MSSAARGSWGTPETVSLAVMGCIYESESDAAFAHVAEYLQDATAKFLESGSSAVLAEMSRDWVCDARAMGRTDAAGHQAFVILDEAIVLAQIERYLDETCVECCSPRDQCDCSGVS